MITTPEQPSRFMYVNVHDVPGTVTSHGSGAKQVLCPELPGALQMKQVAMGNLMPGESIETHAHADMDEYYYFLEGEGNMCVNGTDYFLFTDIFIKVPSGTLHSLQCTNVALRFFYFGLAVLQG